jgi:hypothetical protein
MCLFIVSKWKRASEQVGMNEGVMKKKKKHKKWSEKKKWLYRTKLICNQYEIIKILVTKRNEMKHNNLGIFHGIIFKLHVVTISCNCNLHYVNVNVFVCEDKPPFNLKPQCNCNWNADWILNNDNNNVVDVVVVHCMKKIAFNWLALLNCISFFRYFFSPSTSLSLSLSLFCKHEKRIYVFFFIYTPRISNLFLIFHEKTVPCNIK